MDNSVANNRNKMLNFTDVTRTANIGDTINFSFSMYDANTNACNSSTCSYSLTTSPKESVTSNLASNTITGNFIPSKNGLYSLIISITDSRGNNVKRNILFFIGSTASTTSRYYFRSMSPTHSQPKGNGLDVGLTNSTAPVSDEYNYCSGWTQHSPDEIPNYPISLLTSINTFTWYTSIIDTVIGLKRFIGYGSSIDVSSILPTAANYSSITKTFANLNWGLDYPQSWYSLESISGS